MSDQSSQERISQKLSQGTDRKSKSNVVLISVIVVIALAAVVALVLLLTRQATPETRNVVVTPDNVEEILADMQDQKTEVGTYEVTMNTTWNFDNGEAASTDAYVENATRNTNDVYFDIVRSDTGETIYASPTIPVGSHLENITLDTALGAGTYDCVLTYHLLDESGKAISRLNINLVIVVVN